MGVDIMYGFLELPYGDHLMFTSSRSCSATNLELEGPRSIPLACSSMLPAVCQCVLLFTGELFDPRDYGAVS
jgi:hypothetical protein